MTQADLAREMKTTQTAIARLERRGSNPTVATLDRAIRATGGELRLTSTPASPQVDESQIAAHVRMTPAERVRYHATGYRNMAKLVRAARAGR